MHHRFVLLGLIVATGSFAPASSPASPYDEQVAARLPDSYRGQQPATAGPVRSASPTNGYRTGTTSSGYNPPSGRSSYTGGTSGSSYTGGTTRPSSYNGGSSSYSNGSSGTSRTGSASNDSRTSQPGNGNSSAGSSSGRSSASDGSRSGSGGSDSAKKTADAKNGSKPDAAKSKSDGSWRALQTFLELQQAIQVLNYAMAQASRNPMNDGGRRQVQQAKLEVDFRMTQLEREVARGNLTPAQLVEAKMELAQNVDLEAPTKYAVDREGDMESGSPQVSESEVAARLQRPDAAQAVAVNVEGQNQQIVMRGNSAGRELASTGTAANEERRSPAPNDVLSAKAERDLDQADRILLAANGDGAAPSDKRKEPDGMWFDMEAAPGGERAAKAAGEAKADEAREEREPGGELQKPTRQQEAEARLEQIQAAVAELAPGEVLGDIVPADGAPELHVTGDFSEGKIIAGSFGEGIAGLHIKKTAQGYRVIKLDRRQLLAAYARVGLYWLLIATPFFYGCFWLGSRVHRRRRQPPPGGGVHARAA